MTPFYVKLRYVTATSGFYKELLLHKNFYGSGAWSNMQLKLSPPADAQGNLFVIVFESRTINTGLLNAIRNVSVLQEACINRKFLKAHLILYKLFFVSLFTCLYVYFLGFLYFFQSRRAAGFWKSLLSLLISGLDESITLISD